MDEASLKKQREYRQKSGNSATKKYERTKKGKLMRNYRNMESRIKGIQWRKAHLYEGKPIISRQEFYEWAINNPDFLSLYDAWVRSGYDRKLAPSVDRIDPVKGYEIGNMQWLTHSQNSSRGTFSRNKLYGNPNLRLSSHLRH